MNRNVQYTDRVSPMTDFVHTMSQLFEITSAPITAQLFGNAGIEHMRKYGTFRCHIDIPINYILTYFYI